MSSYKSRMSFWEMATLYRHMVAGKFWTCMVKASSFPEGLLYRMELALLSARRHYAKTVMWPVKRKQVKSLGISFNFGAKMRWKYTPGHTTEEKLNNLSKQRED